MKSIYFQYTLNNLEDNIGRTYFCLIIVLRYCGVMKFGPPSPLATADKADMPSCLGGGELLAYAKGFGGLAR